MRRKYPTLDIVNLIALWNAGKWNQFLNKCLLDLDLQKLTATLYGIQAGMDHAVTSKISSDKIVETFLRLQRSIEITAKKILRAKYPSPLDTGMSAKDVEEFTKHITAKRKRDLEFQKFLRDGSF